MSIGQLRDDIDEYFQNFEKVHFKIAWKRRDSRSCLIWTGLSVISLTGALIFLPASVLTHYVPFLPLVLLVTLICAVRMGDVYGQIRAERLGVRSNNSYLQRLSLQKQWLCTRYVCDENDLPTKARDIRRMWEERQELKKLANNDTMGPRFKALFGLPDTNRFIGLLVAMLAIVATLVTLGSSIDAIFEALKEWRKIGANILITWIFCAEVIMLWIITAGMIREIGPSVLEQLNLSSLSDRRVYRYLLAVHEASEPLPSSGREFTSLRKFVELFFLPMNTLWKKFLILIRFS